MFKHCRKAKELVQKIIQRGQGGGEHVGGMGGGGGMGREMGVQENSAMVEMMIPGNKVDTSNRSSMCSCLIVNIPK